jgi:hypothetical protein
MLGAALVTAVWANRASAQTIRETAEEHVEESLKKEKAKAQKRPEQKPEPAEKKKAPVEEKAVEAEPSPQPPLRFEPSAPVTEAGPRSSTRW